MKNAAVDSNQSDLNPRYVAFARAHGRTPDEQAAYDEARWPGAVMCGFMLWMDQVKQAFRDASPGSFIGSSIADQDAWDAFIAAQADAGVLLEGEKSAK